MPAKQAAPSAAGGAAGRCGVERARCQQSRRRRVRPGAAAGRCGVERGPMPAKQAAPSGAGAPHLIACHAVLVAKVEGTIVLYV